jgi:hypothetical protein
VIEKIHAVTDEIAGVRVAKGTTVNVDEAGSWEGLSDHFGVRTINHQEAARQACRIDLRRVALKGRQRASGESSVATVVVCSRARGDLPRMGGLTASVSTGSYTGSNSNYIAGVVVGGNSNAPVAGVGSSNNGQTSIIGARAPGLPNTAPVTSPLPETCLDEVAGADVSANCP